MSKLIPILLLYLFISNPIQSQSNQQKAEDVVLNYVKNKTKRSRFNPSLKLNPIQVLRSPFSDTKQYKVYQHRIDSLKIAGRKIDARIAKMKTTSKLDQAKKESNKLSKELVATSEQLIEFMTSYKGPQIGWTIKPVKGTSNKIRKTFYLDKELIKVDSVR